MIDPTHTDDDHVSEERAENFNTSFRLQAIEPNFSVMKCIEILQLNQQAICLEIVELCALIRRVTVGLSEMIKNIDPPKN